MNKYERLLVESPVPVNDNSDLPDDIKGLYIETPITDVILISKEVTNTCEKACILAEELGHHFKSGGDITDQSIIANRKQELVARNWAYEKLVPLSGIVQAYEDGVMNKYELVEYLDVIEEFLLESLNYYQRKFGLFTNYKQYIIYFNPLGVLKLF